MNLRLAVALATAVLVCGCSGGGSTDSSTGTATATTEPAPPTIPLQNGIPTWPMFGVTPDRANRVEGADRDHRLERNDPRARVN